MDPSLALEATLEEMLRLMGFEPRVTVREIGDVLSVDVEVREGAGVLIGRGGEGIDALEEVIRRIVRHRTKEQLRLTLDVNGYRREQAAALREFAREKADLVRRRGTPYAFKPMSPRERRIIHLELAARADIITESVGEGSARHIVIRPAR
jgi:spoIIIJ-associated protein